MFHLFIYLLTLSLIRPNSVQSLGLKFHFLTTRLLSFKFLLVMPNHFCKGRLIYMFLFQFEQ